MVYSAYFVGGKGLFRLFRPFRPGKTLSLIFLSPPWDRIEVRGFSSIQSLQSIPSIWVCLVIARSDSDEAISFISDEDCHASQPFGTLRTGAQLAMTIFLMSSLKHSDTFFCPYTPVPRPFFPAGHYDRNRCAIKVNLNSADKKSV
jgi:hypothetical protein